jgi:hypothetical protein
MLETKVTFEVDLPSKPSVTVTISMEEMAEYKRTRYLPDSVGLRVRDQLSEANRALWDLTAGSKNKN